MTYVGTSARALLACMIIGAAIVGCGGSTTSEGDSGVDSGPGEDSGTSDSGVPADAAMLADSGARDSAVPPDAPTAPDAGMQRICGTLGSGPCPRGEYCHFPIEAMCGALDAGGVCEPVGDPGCPEIYAPVCGCDGVTYDNDCFAAAAGMSISATGACGAVAGVNCDSRDVSCRLPEPRCREGFVAAVEGTCWGGCVPIDSCVCTAAEECPHSDTYTCHMSRMRCGPYL